MKWREILLEQKKATLRCGSLKDLIVLEEKHKSCDVG